MRSNVIQKGNLLNNFQLFKSHCFEHEQVPVVGKANMTPSSCIRSIVELTSAPNSRTARLCLASNLSSPSSSPNSTRLKWGTTGLEGRVAACDLAGERSGELNALPISEAVSVLSLLGVGDGWQAEVMLIPPVRPSVRTFRGVEPIVAMESFLWASFLSFSAKTLSASWPSIAATAPTPLRPMVRARRPTFLRTLLITQTTNKDPIKVIDVTTWMHKRIAFLGSLLQAFAQINFLLW